MGRLDRRENVASGNRREFLKLTGALAAASSLSGVAVPRVHASGDGVIKLALIGCGGRGGGAVGNALSAPGGPVKLFAMADLFADRLAGSYKALSKEFGEKIDVPPERQFVGFDAYKAAIDCLGPGDVAMLTGYTAFRPTHLAYAVEKGVHVFMEKPFAPDPVGVRRVIQAGEDARKKNLKIAAGLMWRHSNARQALIQKIRDGAMGQIQLIRAYRMESGYQMGPRKPSQSELLDQLRIRWAFLWASSGIFIELMVHQIDECCWIKDAWPVAAHGIGGRIANSLECGQNLDSYAIEYTFPDGTKALVNGRYLPNCHNEFATYVHGTKCAAQFCVWGASPIHTRTYKDQRITADNIAWNSEPEVNPWQAEWNVLLDAIRRDRPHNEAQRAAYADLASIMGRAAVHSGKIITWDEAVASNFQFCPNVASLTADSPAPVHADDQGRYPAPVPGAWTEI
ncbi:MAG: Gfo/Idh/MocA family oxidoreductase [Pirellulales bacterium]|nr:Gfo/Idh/MocA family oxidoreductase [Pirellulales bacterium]